MATQEEIVSKLVTFLLNSAENKLYTTGFISKEIKSHQYSIDKKIISHKSIKKKAEELSILKQLEDLGYKLVIKETNNGIAIGKEKIKESPNLINERLSTIETKLDKLIGMVKK